MQGLPASFRLTAMKEADAKEAERGKKEQAERETIEKKLEQRLYPYRHPRRRGRPRYPIL